MIRLRLSLCLMAGGLACSGSPRDTLQSFRSALNPPAVPPDTIPEMLEYSPDLHVNVADMAKLPDGVLYLDLVPGDSTAPAAQPGDSVEIGFLGWLPNATAVDSGSALFRVGGGEVIGGIDVSIPGMRQGGRRQLVIPPSLAYGAEGRDDIPPDAVLVYEVTLVRILR